jgi:hypothetical protein
MNFFFLKITATITSQNIDLYSWITLYILNYNASYSRRHQTTAVPLTVSVRSLRNSVHKDVIQNVLFTSLPSKVWRTRSVLYGSSLTSGSFRLSSQTLPVTVMIGTCWLYSSGWRNNACRSPLAVCFGLLQKNHRNTWCATQFVNSRSL